MTYYLSALAVALSFRMNMFNMGVDGQYRLAALLAAALGGSAALPPGVSQVLIILCAMLVGALWAGLAALLKATRGISEVISTIMLNFVATGVVAYLLTPGRLAVSVQGSNNIGTRPIPGSAQVPGLPFPGASSTVFGFVIVAVLAGVGYTVLVNRTRFGFELRATGMASAAAVANGHQRQTHDHHDHAALRGRGGPRRHATTARCLLLILTRLPDGARIHGCRDRTAGTQQCRGHGLRFIALGVS